MVEKPRSAHIIQVALPKMSLSESDTRAKLIDPALHTRGWTKDLIKRKESARMVEIINGQPRRRSRGRLDYTLRVRVNPGTQPVALALIEAKAQAIENVAFDPKAVNPNARHDEDMRTPEELIALIREMGKQVEEALSLLEARQ